MTAIQGTRNMLQFAERCKMESMVYLSSMEVYGIMPKEQVEVKRTDLGYINLWKYVAVIQKESECQNVCVLLLQVSIM